MNILCQREERERKSVFDDVLGGFAASWAAMSYPEISAVILDATFDKLEPLACSRMPDWLSECTHATTVHAQCCSRLVLLTAHFFTIPLCRGISKRHD